MRNGPEYLLIACLFAAGCGGTACPPVSLAEASRETVTAYPPAWTKSRMAFYGFYLIPYTNNPDILITVATPGDLEGEIATLTDAHLEPGFMAGGRFSWEFSPSITASFSVAYYEADTTVDYQIETPPMSGTYEINELAGLPMHMDIEFGAYSTVIPARWFLALGGGYVWYGEEEQQGAMQSPEDEPLAVATTGLEFFGARNMDVRIEAGHVWLFKNRRNQVTAGLSMSFSF